MSDLQKEPSNRRKLIMFWLGVFFLIPPIIGVITFVININYDNISDMRNLTGYWSASPDGGMSAVPIYLGLMAITGAYLLNHSDK